MNSHRQTITSEDNSTNSVSFKALCPSTAETRDFHSIAWTEARGRRTDCGPFSIEFAYVQGAQRDSLLAPEQWHGLTSKLDVLGGLYIYRNGIRILPYGNTENDFLRIEERRNLGAAYYFFSYRRMVGAIELPASSSRQTGGEGGSGGVP